MSKKGERKNEMGFVPVQLVVCEQLYVVRPSTSGVCEREGGREQDSAEVSSTHTHCINN